MESSLPQINRPPEQLLTQLLELQENLLQQGHRLPLHLIQTIFAAQLAAQLGAQFQFVGRKFQNLSNMVFLSAPAKKGKNLHKGAHESSKVEGKGKAVKEQSLNLREAMQKFSKLMQDVQKLFPASPRQDGSISSRRHQSLQALHQARSNTSDPTKLIMLEQVRIALQIMQKTTNGPDESTLKNFKALIEQLEKLLPTLRQNLLARIQSLQSSEMLKMLFQVIQKLSQVLQQFPREFHPSLQSLRQDLDSLAQTLSRALRSANQADFAREGRAGRDVQPSFSRGANTSPSAASQSQGAQNIASQASSQPSVVGRFSFLPTSPGLFNIIQDLAGLRQAQALKGLTFEVLRGHSHQKMVELASDVLSAKASLAFVVPYLPDNQKETRISKPKKKKPEEEEEDDDKEDLLR